MFNTVVSFGILAGIIEILFYILGILCFIKYLRKN